MPGKNKRSDRRSVTSARNGKRGGRPAKEPTATVRLYAVDVAPIRAYAERHAVSDADAFRALHPAAQ